MMEKQIKDLRCKIDYFVNLVQNNLNFSSTLESQSLVPVLENNRRHSEENLQAKSN